MTKIRPPRTPRGENPKVTIANQAKQIIVLIERCVTLETERNSALVESSDWHNKFMGQWEVTGSITQRLSDLQEANLRLLGWQDCARELFDREADTLP